MDIIITLETAMLLAVVSLIVFCFVFAFFTIRLTDIQEREGRLIERERNILDHLSMIFGEEIKKSE